MLTWYGAPDDSGSIDEKQIRTALTRHANTAAAADQNPPMPDPRAYRLTLTPIRREIEVQLAVTLKQLHTVVQAATNTHRARSISRQRAPRREPLVDLLGQWPREKIEHSEASVGSNPHQT
jgi:hypothetical protein